MKSLQLTETSSRYARKISGTTALQEALKEKQQHIEQLLAERDLERAEVAKATSHICEVEKELAALKARHLQVWLAHINTTLIWVFHLLRLGTNTNLSTPFNTIFKWISEEQMTFFSYLIQYATETESNLQQVRALLASTQKDKMELANQLEEERR